MKSLLDAGADLNVQDKNGDTALHWACMSGKIQAVKLLINAGADINCKNHEGDNCFDAAVKQDHHDIAKYLKVGDV